MINIKNEKKIRLVIIATIPRFFVHLIKNIKEYEKNNIEVQLLCSNESYGEYLRNEHHFSVDYIEIPREISPFKDLKSLLELYCYFRKNQFDIVHSLTPKAGLLVALAAFAARSPIRLHTFTGQRWATLKNPKRLLLKLLDKLVINLNTRCFADSDSQIKYLIDEGVAKSTNIFCIHKGSLGGVDTEKFKKENHLPLRQELAAKYNIPTDVPWILFLGRVTKDKGINELIKAFEMSLAKVDACLVLVGPYESHLDPIDQSSIDAITNNSKIFHLGFQNKPEEIIPACDFICLPSYREGFGTVIIEAAAAGLSAVGSDIPGLQDAILDQKTGILVPPYDVEILSEKIVMLCQNKEQLKTLSENAYLRAKNDFDYKTIVKFQLREYFTLMKITKE